MRTTPLCTAALVLLTLTSAAAAQDQAPFRARSVFPADYTNLVQADLVAIRDSGLWDEITTGLAKSMVTLIEKETEISLEALDRVTMIPKRRNLGNEPHQHGSAFHNVVVIEGNRALPTPKWAESAENSRYVGETIGGREVKRTRSDYRRWSDDLFFQPRPEVWVMGPVELLQPTLEGKTTAGMPSPELMSLTATRQTVLAQTVMHLEEEPDYEDALRKVAPEREWPQGERPEYVLVRLVALDDPDDPRFELQAIIRHPKEGAGVDVTEKALDGLLKKAKETRQMLLFLSILNKVERARDRADLVLTLDLGLGRAAAGTLATIFTPLLLFTAGDAQVEAVGAIEVVEVVEEVEEPPPPPPVEEKKKGGKKG